MKRLLVIGVLIEIGLLIVGLTWIAPLAGGSGANAESASAVPYRVDRADGNVVNVDLTARETVQRIAPGVRYHVWTFNGTTPGPVIRVHLGDTVHFTLTNDSTIRMQHSIDFHAAMTPWANLPAKGQTTLEGNYQPVNPGQTKTFDWVAMFPGVFMYHCGVPPVLQHISNGMYGAIIVEPDGLPKAREYVLVSSEFYPGSKPVNGVYEGDYDRMLAVDPQYVVFNGVADQYKTAPLVARPNELVRLWVLNAGPTLTDAFHVIGAMFDNVYSDGNPANVLHGVQTYNVPPGGTAMFELTIPDPGLYPFVTHAFAYTGLGSVGLIEVDPNAPPAPSSYPMFADPFSAGVKPVGSAPSAVPTPAPAPSPSGGTGVTASCSPTGTSLKLAAKNMAFDTDCLAAPAGKAFAIAFVNQDAGVPHNMSIYTDNSAATPLFQGKLVSGTGSITYKVPALAAGTYYFRCDVHPTQMFGTFIVK
jgi:nitrite reductase (NO-forming)